MVQSNNLFNVFSKFLSFKGATSKRYSLPTSNLRPACTRTSVTTDNSGLNWTPSRKNSTLEPLDLYTLPHAITSRLLAISVNYCMYIYMYINGRFWFRLKVKILLYLAHANEVRKANRSFSIY